MDRAKLYDELKDYSKEDLELIASEQQELYTPEEMAFIREMISQKTQEDTVHEEEDFIDQLPDEITCPKCLGMNPFSNDTCCFCNYKLDKSKYYVMNYEEEEEEEKGSSYTFQYVISFLIPLIGYILGAILLSKEDEEQRSVGKKCIILGICATLLGVLLYVLAILVFPVLLI